MLLLGSVRRCLYYDSLENSPPLFFGIVIDQPKHRGQGCTIPVHNKLPLYRAATNYLLWRRRFCWLSFPFVVCLAFFRRFGSYSFAENNARRSSIRNPSHKHYMQLTRVMWGVGKGYSDNPHENLLHMKDVLTLLVEDRLLVNRTIRLSYAAFNADPRYSE